MNKLKKYYMGTGKEGIIREYIEPPQHALVRNELAKDKAEYTASKNPFVQGLEILGPLMVSAGMNMQNKGQGFNNNDGITSNTTDNSSGAMNTLLSLDKLFKAYGGDIENNIPVEVEGEEVAEMPNGNNIKFKGKSHEEGGIETLLPEGTRIYSDRIKIDGVSMADRKGKRKKKEIKFEELLASNTSDFLLKNSFKRVQETNKIADEQDNKIQESVDSAMKIRSMLENQNFPNSSEEPQFKFEFGGEIPPPFIPGESLEDVIQAYENYQSPYYQMEKPNPNLKSIQNITGNKNIGSIQLGTPEYNIKPTTIEANFDGNYSNPTKNIFDLLPIQKRKFDNQGFSYFGEEGTLFDNNDSKNSNNNNSNSSNNNNSNNNNSNSSNNNNSNNGSSSWYKNLFGNPTGGDLLGLGGSLYNIIAPSLNTKKNRAGDTPNINPFEYYGNESLNTLENSKTYVEDQKARQLQDLETSKNALQKRLRNSARGVNTQRALDLSSYAQTNKAENQINQNYTNQMLQLLGQEIGLENQRDQIYMKGEQMKDLADRQDRDNYYTQRAKDIVGKGLGIQSLGKSLNQIKTNSDNKDMILAMEKKMMEDNIYKQQMMELAKLFPYLFQNSQTLGNETSNKKPE